MLLAHVTGRSISFSLVYYKTADHTYNTKIPTLDATPVMDSNGPSLHGSEAWRHGRGGYMYRRHPWWTVLLAASLEGLLQVASSQEVTTTTAPASRPFSYIGMYLDTDGRCEFFCITFLL